MIEHPLRRKIVGEMYLRRWPAVSLPVAIVQVLRLVEEEERPVEAQRLGAARGTLFAEYETINSYFSTAKNEHDVSFVWERHTEGSSGALFLPAETTSNLPQAAADEHVGPLFDWLMDFPGKIVRATQIWVCADDAAAAQIISAARFRIHDLVSCEIGPGMRIWSDFRIQDDGFGRVVVAANGANPAQVIDYVQRLQELGNYRNLALLGLPLARSHWEALNGIEDELSKSGAKVVSRAAADEVLLQEISSQSIDLVSIEAETSYRMSATKAYGNLVEDRLRELAVVPIDGSPSLTDFIHRRLSPALRTCVAFKERHSQISIRSEQLVSLLRARIGTAIEGQNTRILQSMERSAQMQLHLQQLVEGFSVVALSYYAVGLLGYVLKGVDHAWLINSSPLLACLVPLVLAVMLVSMRTVKARSFHKELS